MTDYRLSPRTAFGSKDAKVIEIGNSTLTERPDIAIASVTARKGVVALDAHLVDGGVAVGAWQETKDRQIFWSAADQWFVLANHDSEETLSLSLKDSLKDQASVTEQNDGWVVFDLSGDGLCAVLQRLCNIDVETFGAGKVQRTVIEHIGCFVLCSDPDKSYRLLCGRSFAASFAHAIEVIMAAQEAQLKLNAAAPSSAM